MKKLLGLLAVSPLALSGCGCGSEEKVAEKEPIVDKETVVEIHEDKAHLLNLYRVENYEAVGTAIRGSIQFYMEAKDGADLSEWDWVIEIDITSTIPMKVSGILDSSMVNRYTLGHDINSDRVVNFAMYLSLTSANSVDLKASDIEAYHNDEERGEERVAAFNALTSTTETSVIAATKNKYAYKDETETTPEVKSFFNAINLIGTDKDGDEYITDLTKVAE